MFGRKGQGAMEYLMTYGWAVLVVMVVGVVMWQLGIFNIGTTSVTSSGFPKIKPQLPSCKMTTGGDFSCLFTNGAGSAVAVNETLVSVGGADCYPDSPEAGTRVDLGENFQVMATGCQEGVSGEPYSASVYIYYTVYLAGTTVTHNDTGKVKGPYENIA
ncbi:MAG: hypothetical protein V1703_04500 [Candidatus Altiarchaeota archaeon]